MQEISMSGVQLNEARARGLRPDGSVSKGLHDAGDLSNAQCARSLIAFRERERAGGKDGRPSALGGRDRLASIPWLAGACLPACMRQLDSGHRSLFGDEGEGAAQWLHVRVRPYAQVLWADASVGGDSGSFRNDSGSTPHGAASQMNKMPIGGEAIFARVLAHG